MAVVVHKVVDTTSAKILASFHPQAWLNGCAIGVDAGGQCSWSIDLSDLDAEEDSNDYLVGTSEAPSWIKSWSGPFEITLDFSSLGEQLIKVTTVIGVTGPVDQRLLDHLGQRSEDAFMKLCAEGDATPNDSPNEAYPWTGLELVGVESTLFCEKEGVE